MRYIKIRANTYNEAMMKLKMDHGDDAIPISHKYVKEGGMFKSRFFARDVVELTAAVHERKSSMRARNEEKRVDVVIGGDEPTGTVPVLERTATESSSVNDESEGKGFLDKINRTIDDINDNLNGISVPRRALNIKPPRSVNSGTPGPANPATQVASGDEPAVSARFEREFQDIKDTLNKLLKDHDREPEPERVVVPHSDEDTLIGQYEEILKNNDFDNEECSLIINDLKNSISRDDLRDKFKIEKSMKDLLKSRIVTTGAIKLGNKKKILMFTGPTGVGKTTTMAKLGALYSLREGHRVVFITIDNYRIAATEQLKKYAEIMRIPVFAVNNQKEFKEIIDKEKAEIIMVDTSGRSHKNELKISEIKSFADLIEYDFEKILCVSANTKKSDISEVFRAFDCMEINSVIITKVDETSFIGNVVDVADKYNKPISYFSNGQEVPNDIVVADPDKIVDMMMGNINN